MSLSDEPDQGQPIELPPELILLIENAVSLARETICKSQSDNPVLRDILLRDDPYEVLTHPDFLALVADNCNLPREQVLQYRFQKRAIQYIEKSKKRKKLSSVGGKRSSVTRQKISRGIKAANDYETLLQPLSDRSERASLKKELSEKHAISISAINLQLRKRKKE